MADAVDALLRFIRGELSNLLGKAGSLLTLLGALVSNGPLVSRAPEAVVQAGEPNLSKCPVRVPPKERYA